MGRGFEGRAGRHTGRWAAGLAATAGLGIACDERPVARDDEQAGCQVVDGLSGGAPLKGAATVEAGDRSACALLADGRVACWGDWSGPRTFVPDDAAVWSPTQARLVPGLTGVRAISVHDSGACAATADGRAVCWETPGAPGVRPVPVTGAADVVDVSGDRVRGCTLDAGGEVRCWGLGSGAFIVPEDIVAEPVPGGTGVQALHKDRPGAFLRRDGAVYAWESEAGGITFQGDLPAAIGLSGRVDLCGWTVAGKVVCLTGPAPALDATGGARVDLEACALDADGRLRCTGERASALWDLSALGEVKAFALGWPGYGCAVREAGGEVVCWGKGEVGQLGDRAQPYAVRPVVSACFPPLDDVATGVTSTCVLDALGGVACAGADDPVLRPVDALGAPRELAAFGDRFCGLDAESRLRCVDREWRRGGWNFEPGHLDARIGPDAQFSPGVRQVVLGGDLVCALRKDARVECAWRDREAEPDAFGPVGLVPGVSGAVSVAAGAAFACARLASGRVRCWGSDRMAQLGRGCPKGGSPFGGGCIGGDTTRPGPESPSVEVPGLEDVVALALGGETACVVDTHGDVRCWGHECYRPHGFSDQGSWGELIAPTPAPVSDAVSIAAGPYCRFCATLRDDSVVCFGHGYATEPFRADNPPIPGPEPQPVPGLTAPRALAVGYLHTCALTGEGGLSCWGYGGQGQLADGQPRFRATPAPVVWAR